MEFYKYYCMSTLCLLKVCDRSLWLCLNFAGQNKHSKLGCFPHSTLLCLYKEVLCRYILPHSQTNNGNSVESLPFFSETFF